MSDSVGQWVNKKPRVWGLGQQSCRHPHQQRRCGRRGCSEKEPGPETVQRWLFSNQSNCVLKFMHCMKHFLPDSNILKVMCWKEFWSVSERVATARTDCSPAPLQNNSFHWGSHTSLGCSAQISDSSHLLRLTNSFLHFIFTVCSTVRCLLEVKFRLSVKYYL